jgi:hypothetical protein
VQYRNHLDPKKVQVRHNHLNFEIFFIFSVVRTVTTVAGQAPVDAECTTMLGKAHVYTENKDIFDCMLNQVRCFAVFYLSFFLPRGRSQSPEGPH